MTVVKIEDAQDIQARPGEAITLEVPSANTTGYLWQLNANPEAVEVVGHEVIADEENFGGAGIERFTVRPLRGGDVTVHFELKAPWENDPAEVREVRVHTADK